MSILIDNMFFNREIDMQNYDELKENEERKADDVNIERSLVIAAQEIGDEKILAALDKVISRRRCMDGMGWPAFIIGGSLLTYAAVRFATYEEEKRYFDLVWPLLGVSIPFFLSISGWGCIELYRRHKAPLSRLFRDENISNLESELDHELSHYTLKSAERELSDKYTSREGRRLPTVCGMFSYKKPQQQAPEGITKKEVLESLVVARRMERLAHPSLILMPSMFLPPAIISTIDAKGKVDDIIPFILFVSAWDLFILLKMFYTLYKAPLSSYFVNDVSVINAAAVLSRPIEQYTLNSAIFELEQSIEEEGAPPQRSNLCDSITRFFCCKKPLPGDRAPLIALVPENSLPPAFNN